jgi:hypothetical protein
MSCFLPSLYITYPFLFFQFQIRDEYEHIFFQVSIFCMLVFKNYHTAIFVLHWITLNQVYEHDNSLYGNDLLRNAVLLFITLTGPLSCQQ